MPSRQTILEMFVDTAKTEPFGFQVSPADTCMLFKQNELGVCIITMYLMICSSLEKRTDTRVCLQNTERTFCEDVENLNQARSERWTVKLRFSWEGVLNHTWISPWTQKGILLCEMDPRKRSVTYVFMNDETSV